MASTGTEPIRNIFELPNYINGGNSSKIAIQKEQLRILLASKGSGDVIQAARNKIVDLDFVLDASSFGEVYDAAQEIWLEKEAEKIPGLCDSFISIADGIINAQ